MIATNTAVLVGAVLSPATRLLPEAEGLVAMRASTTRYTQPTIARAMMLIVLIMTQDRICGSIPRSLLVSLLLTC